LCCSGSYSRCDGQLSRVLGQQVRTKVRIKVRTKSQVALTNRIMRNARKKVVLGEGVEEGEGDKEAGEERGGEGKAKEGKEKAKGAGGAETTVSRLE
jgi:hypothetical protein